MNHPIVMLVVATLLVATGLHLLIANKGWMDKYMDILGSWDITLSPRFIMGMVLVSGFIAALSGIALGIKAFTELLYIY
jgi:hypothetical protein